MREFWVLLVIDRLMVTYRNGDVCKLVSDRVLVMACVLCVRWLFGGVSCGLA